MLGKSNKYHISQMGALPWQKSSSKKTPLKSFQDISNRTHGPRIPKPGVSNSSSNLLRGPLGFGPIQFLMESCVCFVLGKHPTHRRPYCWWQPEIRHPPVEGTVVGSRVKKTMSWYPWIQTNWRFRCSSFFIFSKYGWWRKSCTSWYGKYIPLFTGF